MNSIVIYLCYFHSRHVLSFTVSIHHQRINNTLDSLIINVGYENI